MAARMRMCVLLTWRQLLEAQGMHPSKRRMPRAPEKGAGDGTDPRPTRFDVIRKGPPREEARGGTAAAQRDRSPLTPA